MWFWSGLALGFVLGFGAAAILYRHRRRTARDLARALFEESDRERKADRDAVVSQLRELARSDRQIDARELESKKELIDKTLQGVGGKLEEKLTDVSKRLETLDKDWGEKLGTLTGQLHMTGEQIASLARTSSSLREALGSTKARGQWGQRVAEDVLTLAGFLENVDFRKEAPGAAGTRPDFTFPVPPDRKLNMDAKFPFDNYVKYLEAASGADQEA